MEIIPNLYIREENYSWFKRAPGTIPANEIWIFDQKQGRTIIRGSETSGPEKFPTPSGPFSFFKPDKIQQFRKMATYTDRIALFRETELSLEVDLEVNVTLINPIAYLEIVHALDASLRVTTEQLLKAHLKIALENMISLSPQSKEDGRISPFAPHDLVPATLDTLLPGRNIGPYIEIYPRFQQMGVKVQATVEYLYASIAYQQALRFGTDSSNLNDRLSYIMNRLSSEVPYQANMSELYWRERLYTAVVRNWKNIFPQIKPDLEKITGRGAAQERRAEMLQTRFFSALLKDFLRLSLNTYIQKQTFLSQPRVIDPLYTNPERGSKERYARFDTMEIRPDQMGNIRIDPDRLLQEMQAPHRAIEPPAGEKTQDSRAADQPEELLKSQLETPQIDSSPRNENTSIPSGDELASASEQTTTQSNIHRVPTEPLTPTTQSRRRKAKADQEPEATIRPDQTKTIAPTQHQTAQPVPLPVNRQPAPPPQPPAPQRNPAYSSSTRSVNDEQPVQSLTLQTQGVPMKQLLDITQREKAVVPDITREDIDRYEKRRREWGSQRDNQLEALYSEGQRQGWLISPPLKQVQENVYIDIGDAFRCRIWLVVPSKYPDDQAARPTVEAVYKMRKLPQDHINNLIKKVFGNTPSYDLYMLTKAIADHLRKLLAYEDGLEKEQLKQKEPQV